MPGLYKAARPEPRPQTSRNLLGQEHQHQHTETNTNNTITMNRSITCLLFVALTLVLSVTCQSDSMLAPPGRPVEFRSPDQLRRYLKALNDYYAIVGRPRFGRSADKQTLGQAFEQQAVGNDYGYLWDDVLSRDQYDSTENDAVEELLEFQGL